MVLQKHILTSKKPTVNKKQVQTMENQNILVTGGMVKWGRCKGGISWQLSE